MFLRNTFSWPDLGNKDTGKCLLGSWTKENKNVDFTKNLDGQINKYWLQDWLHFPHSTHNVLNTKGRCAAWF